MAIKVKKQIEYWLKTAESDFETAKLILKSGKNLHHSCFFCHLVLEKTVKALVVRETEQIPPYSHDLIMLSARAGLELDEEMKIFFEQMNRFVIEARYPDEQFRLYRKTTREFTKSCLGKTEQYHAKFAKLARQ